MSAPPEGLLAELAALLEIERRDEIAALAEARRTLDAAALEAAGETIERLEVVDEEAGFGGLFFVALARANGEPLPPGGIRVGDVAALHGPEEPAGDRPLSGVIARRAADRVTIALDDEPPEWVAGTRLRLDRLADDATYRKLRAALERVRAARRGERLFELRELFLSRRAVPERGAPGASRSRDPAPTRAEETALAALDPSQRAAVRNALSAPDVALIHGPPGTGKTTAVVALVEAAVARGDRVLACAASNAAVDVLAERLDERGLAPVRLGHPARIAPAVLASSLDERVRAHDDAKLARKLLGEALALRRRLSKWTRAAPDREERGRLRLEAKALRDDARRIADGAIDRILTGAGVVCATLTGAAGEPLCDRTFDLVVIDEAAQALEPACWIALARAGPRGRVVLAGDHLQLPPTVTSLEAARRGLGRTLFERLHRDLPGAAYMLETQYRMHEAIAAFPSARFYEGRLAAAPANRRHVLAELPGVELADPWTSEPAIFFDTSGCGFDEERARSAPARSGAPPAVAASVSNPGEADLAARIVREILRAGVRARGMGVIAPYAAQVALLRERLAAEVAAGLEVGTADGFQGREREAVVISLVRSNPDGEIGFLSDHRRANVALTRARRALVVVGDGATLGADAFYAALIEHFARAGALRSAWELL